MLLYGMSWFSLVSIRQWICHGTLVVKVLIIYFWYGYSHIGIEIDWNNGFVAIDQSFWLLFVVYIRRWPWT